VIISDATIFKARERLGYAEHWETEISALNDAMKRVGQENLQGVREDLDLYARIRTTRAVPLSVRMTFAERRSGGAGGAPRCHALVRASRVRTGVDLPPRLGRARRRRPAGR
jgi:hypothetical protein